MALCDRCKNKCKFMLKNKTLDTCGLFEKQTNFDRITKTPEALAEFIIDKLQYCKRPVCPICPVWKKCDGVSKEAFVKWLKQESKNENMS